MISKNVNLIFQPQLMLKKIEKKKLSFLENRKNEKKKKSLSSRFLQFCLEQSDVLLRCWGTTPILQPWDNLNLIGEQCKEKLQCPEGLMTT